MSNVLSDDWEAELPEPFRLKVSRVGAAAGAERLAATVYDIAPGGAVSPYHLHHGIEEMLVVLSGRPTLRTPDGVRELEPGELVAFPAGERGAHRVSNRGGEPARVLLVSEVRYPEVAEHLDSGTMLAITGAGDAGPEGRLFPAGASIEITEAMRRSMQASAEAEAGGDED